MPKSAQDNAFVGVYDDLPDLPYDLSPEAIMIAVAEECLSVEERVRRALDMYGFRLLSVQGLPIHGVVVARFAARDNIGLYLRSLAKVLSAALAHHKVAFDKDSVSVSGTGRSGQVAFMLTEPFDGEWARC